ncbi:MAG TPA: hypothetical protein DCQ26_05400 [Marinilabiliales bacterium]|jgi:uncharacterized SAM-binding protein YcdF (DUF218 family)|nr:MAG: hypothetical protein A2W95_15035 [Bacteroidetes bacterium GWA2_40_14]OFX65423.1 MAG: hypothetical protein A2W84_18955 [Bacteroidetes bacterium GWC2_40_13]OFX73962.1 MAG: hypothetical protein A2W96_11630 [Bacteroidetes bacterium GWD2_40_43]OFX93204.1 MAG: hypothetical protein A2W97_06440 [Bacteroidetes bacterium GWE2_40_63]OFY21574.1 MAG: hypothetical protein A2W88_10440 [Bacteroidetes bacterium GWF2_40_13]HAM98025.1 hypothetical protein [Marinilabiliales bacterium]
MFFALSKIIGIFLNPIIWILGLLLWAVIAKKPKRKKGLLFATLFLFLLFSNAYLLNAVLFQWERRSVHDSSLKPQYQYGIVLSGMVWYDTETKHLNFLQSSDRIWQAVRLYKENRIEKILITGGTAGFFKEDTIESALLKKFLVRIGIPEGDVMTEEASRNTHENALFTAQLLSTEPQGNLLLITSAMHMRRAEQCFEKEGLHCDSYPTDRYSGNNHLHWDDLLIPSAQTLFNWNAFTHELFGMLSYKIMGYI